jgi:hypothetical protein
VLDLDRLPDAERRRFQTASGSPYLLGSFGSPLPELPADQIAPIERQWLREVLR